MFCNLYVFYDGTSIPLHEREKCSKECQYYSNGCTIGYKRAEKLSTTCKYGWMLQQVLFLYNYHFVSRSGSTKYLAALSMTHPASEDVWIVKCERLKDDKWIPVFRFHQGHEGTEFDDLDSLNKWIIHNISYDGRKLTLDDFKQQEEKIDASNSTEV